MKKKHFEEGRKLTGIRDELNENGVVKNDIYPSNLLLCNKTTGNLKACNNNHHFITLIDSIS